MKEFTTGPHGHHEVKLLEDHEDYEHRIFQVATRLGSAVRFLGSELDSLLGWWLNERQRPGKTEAS